MPTRDHIVTLRLSAGGCRYDVRVNDVPVSDEKAVLRPSDLTAEGVIKLSFGRKKHVLLRPAPAAHAGELELF